MVILLMKSFYKKSVLKSMPRLDKNMNTTELMDSLNTLFTIKSKYVFEVAGRFLIAGAFMYLARQSNGSLFYFLSIFSLILIYLVTLEILWKLEYPWFTNWLGRVFANRSIALPLLTLPLSMLHLVACMYFVYRIVGNASSGCF